MKILLLTITVFFLEIVTGLSQQNIALCKLAEAIPVLQLSNWKNCSSISDATIPPSYSGLLIRNGVVNSLTINSPFNGRIVTGSIPSEIGLLKDLTSITITNTLLTGIIPPEIVSEKLNFLSLSFNKQLSGTIPLTLTNPSKITMLYLNGCVLSGTIPSTMFSTNIVYINLSENRLSGTIPDFSSVVTKTIIVNNNLLEGTIPVSFSEIPDFIANNNKLLGTIPLMRKVTRLILNNNLLTGIIPSSMERIGQLSIANNLLTGTIPVLPETIYNLNLADNILSGEIPPNLLMSKNIGFINLANNSLIGSIPCNISNSGSLSYFSIRNNRVSGTIPYKLATSMFKMNYIDISYNKISGTIPPGFGYLPPAYIDFSNNQLSGSIPIGYFSNLIYRKLNLENNSFSGCPPAEPNPLNKDASCNLGGWFYSGCVTSTSVRCKTFYKDDCKKGSGFYGKNCKPCDCQSGYLCDDGFIGSGECQLFNPCRGNNCEGNCNINGLDFVCSCSFPGYINATDKRSCICPDGYFLFNKSCTQCSKIDNCFSTVRCQSQNSSICDSCKNGYKLVDGNCVINKECTFDTWNQWTQCQSCSGGIATRYRNLSINNTALPVYCQEFLFNSTTCGYPCIDSTIISQDAIIQYIYQSLTQWDWLANQFTGITIEKVETEILIISIDQDMQNIADTIVNITEYILPSVPKERYIGPKIENNKVRFSVSQEDDRMTIIIIVVVLAIVGLLIISFVAFYLLRKDNEFVSTLPKNLQHYFQGYDNWKKEGNLYSKLVSMQDSDFQRLWSKLSTDGIIVKEVYRLCNPILGASFANYRQLLSQRMRDSPDLFCRKDWLLKEDRDNLRSYVNERYLELVKYFGFNEGIPIIPCLHATDFNVGKSIAGKGFCALASLDAGFYGKGIYFTTYGGYTVPYFINREDPAILISLGVFGNAYPVIENPTEKDSFVGVPTMSGYQSHFVVTNDQGYPIKKKNGKIEYNELVVSQESQVVAIYLVRVSNNKNDKLMMKDLIKSRGNSLTEPLLLDESYI